MELNKYEVREKKLRKLNLLSSEIDRELRENPYVPVEPYRYGWMIHADLRSDAKNRWDAPYMLEALRVCTHSYHTNDIRVVRAARSGNTTSLKKGYSKRLSRKMRASARRYNRMEANLKRRGLWYRGRAQENVDTRDRLNNIMPPKHDIDDKVYESLPIEVKKFFGIDMLHKDKEGHLVWYKNKYHCNIPTYYMRARAEVHYVTEIFAKNPELESKAAYIDSKLEELRHMGYNRWRRNYGYHFCARRFRSLQRDLIRKYLRREVDTDGVEAEKLRFMYDYYD